MQIRLILLDFDGTLAAHAARQYAGLCGHTREAGYALTEEE